MSDARGSGGGPARPRRADATRNAALLLAAARDLIAEGGPDVPLDDIARRAGVGNATLYRNFPTRGDLLAAIYADEVSALCRQGTELLDARHPAEALFTWLDCFVRHIATKRALALAVTERPDERRSDLFEIWHRSITETATALLQRASAVAAVRPDLTVADLLALTSAAAIASTDEDHARHLLTLLREGFAPSPP
jgi:AcrR family transcriptional regulator